MPLTRIALPPPADTDERGGFPWSVPLVRHGFALELRDPVTILVGENGSGKSTLLEALAWAVALPLAGSIEQPERDPTLAATRELGDALELAWTQRSRRGLFLRAEDYFGFVKAQNRRKAELRAELARAAAALPPELPEFERRRRLSPWSGSVAALEARYGRDLDARSHGESFLDFFAARLRGPGLYLLDEPEAALSPQRQLALLALVKDAVSQGGQFLIASHAPIVMGCPGATIVELVGGELLERTFGELEHVRLLRSFLADPEAFVRHL